MNSYELTLLFDPNLGEEGIGVIVARVEDKIKNLGAEIARTDKWGTKRLASLIHKARKLKAAYYVLIYFKAEPAVPAKLEGYLKITENIIRHGIIRAEEKQLEGIEGVPLAAEAGIETVNVGEIKEVAPSPAPTEAGTGEGSGQS